MRENEKETEREREIERATDEVFDHFQSDFHGSNECLFEFAVQNPFFGLVVYEQAVAVSAHMSDSNVSHHQYQINEIQMYVTTNTCACIYKCVYLYIYTVVTGHCSIWQCGRQKM